MAINLLKIQPHQVSKDLSGYITYIYGTGKIGKTTFGAQMPNALILAFQKGYNALPGVYVQDVTSWADMKLIIKQLRKKDVQQRFKSIIIDTIDIAAAACEKYILDLHNVSALSELPWGQGWVEVKKEIEGTFREITQLGYAVLFISHDKDKTFKLKNGTEFNQIVPTLSNSYNEIIKNMVDIYGYAHVVLNKDNVPTRVLTLRSGDGTIDCGSRFKYIQPEVGLSYPALVQAVNDAINREAEASGKQFVTDSRNTSIAAERLEFDELVAECSKIYKAVPLEKQEYYKPRFTDIIEKYLGRGKTLNQIQRSQTEQLLLIVTDLRELLTKNGIVINESQEE